MVRWKLVYTKQAQKDAKKLSSAGLRSNTEAVLDILKKNPFQTPPPYEKPNKATRLESENLKLSSI